MSQGEDGFFKTVTLGGHGFPGAWQYLLPEEFQWLKPPPERLADCSRCYNVARGEFDESCQCCTYFPQISNFMVGMALKDPASAGVVESLIERGFALPLEMAGSPAQYGAAMELYTRDLFGRDRNNRCPFHDPQTHDCAVYPYRNSVCATFSCDHGHGQTSTVFWDALQTVVAYLEVALAQWSMSEVGLDHDGYINRLNGLADRVDRCSDGETGGWSREALDVLWGEYAGREREFYVLCADQVLAHRSELYELANQVRVKKALPFERAVNEWIPEEFRGPVIPIEKEPGKSQPIPPLWYKLQVAARNLWQLPCGDGRVQLAEGITFRDNPRDDPESLYSTDKPVEVVLGDTRLFVSTAQADLLGLFKTAQALDERLLERPESQALEEPRDFLARCLRRDVLVHCGES